jgi:hypothetical protein
LQKHILEEFLYELIGQELQETLLEQVEQLELQAMYLIIII